MKRFLFICLSVLAIALTTNGQNATIIGPDYICYGDTVCYQLQNLPAGGTCNWSLSYPTLPYGTCYEIVQGQGTTTLYVTYTDSSLPVPITSEGGSRIFPPGFQMSNSVKATITQLDNSTYTVTKKVHNPRGQVPTIECSATGPWIAGQTRHFFVTNNSDAPADSIRWEIMDVLLGLGPENNDTTYSYSVGTMTAYTPRLAPTYLREITITATNNFEACEEQSASIVMGVSSTLLMLCATPNGSLLNISVFQENEEHQRIPAELKEGCIYTLELSHNIYGVMRTKSAFYVNEQMDTNGLPSGTYVLSLKENGYIVALTKVQI